ncbi:MAG TPA: hypothetical protein VMZ28_08770 [Kofleriaceae bacterium]|nr:hypothetical protein [Kofleriaceae bacterium]
MFLVSWWFTSGCGGAAPAAAKPTCPRGDVTVQTSEEAAALAPCTAIEGNLTIGPSMALTSLAGLERITRVGGALVLRGNLVLAGAYFPALVAAGAIVIEDNRLLETASLHHVGRAREVSVRRNRALERLDLGALAGGTVALDDNPRLDMVDLGRARERPPRGDGPAVPR